MKKHWEQSGFFPSPLCSSQHALLSYSVSLCFAKMVTFLMRSRECCAVVNKLSTLFGFAAHCKTQDFNISLDELLFIQVFKGNIQLLLEHLFIVKCSHFSISGGLSQPKNLKPNSLKTIGPWPSAFSNNSILLLKTVAADLPGIALILTPFFFATCFGDTSFFNFQFFQCVSYKAENCPILSYDQYSPKHCFLDICQSTFNSCEKWS